jgi:UDP:flavonoid glycosyltransferase YjiC (YdhE family)
MSRVLAYTSPARGHLYPAVSILDELRRRGHEIAVRTLAAEVPAMRRLGFEAAPIAVEVEALEMDDWRARGQAAKIRRATGVFASRVAHDATDLERAIGEVEPDAVLVDVLTLGALCAAEAWGGPRACFSPPPLPLASQAGPPMGLGLRPARGALGRIRDRAVLVVTRAGFDRILLGELNHVRGGLGLAPLGHAEELFLEPPLLLYMTAEPFEFPRPDWPARIVMVGPCEWEPDGALPAELAAVEDPLVLVTNSTEAQDDGRLIAVALEALAEEPVHVVATLSAGEAPASPPANATVLGFAAHGPILEHAACAITHGGMGGTQKALARGVPVCVVPFGRDQAEVARRVEEAGAGTRLPASRLQPGRLREKVREASACGEGAARIATAFAAAGGAVAAADAFEAMLDRQRAA